MTDTWGRWDPMRGGSRRGLRTALAGSLLVGGLTALSLTAASALTAGTASPATTLASTTSSTIPGPTCAAGLTPHVLTAVYPTGSFTGLFCVNAHGVGSYTQGSVSGSGSVTTLAGTTTIEASGWNLLLQGTKIVAKGGFVEVAPVPAIGSFTLS